MERYKIFARNQKCHSASELGLGRIYFFCQMPICRIIWLFLVGYRISGRIIRQCRISGSTLLLNRGFTYLPASLIKIENRVSLSPADPDFYLHVYKQERVCSLKDRLWGRVIYCINWIFLVSKIRKISSRVNLKIF